MLRTNRLFQHLAPNNASFTIKRKSDAKQIEELNEAWEAQKKAGTYRERDYTAQDVVKLRDANLNELTVQKQIAAQFKAAIDGMDTYSNEHFKALGAYTPWQALAMSKAIKKEQALARAAGKPEPRGAIYLSGWMVAALANEWGLLSDQSMHPKTAVVELVRRINLFFDQQDTFAKSRGELKQDETYRLPIVVDIDAGFGGVVATYLLAKELIKAGAAAIHIEDQDSNNKKCGHMGGKVIVPTSEHIHKLNAVRLAADTLGVTEFTVISRTDSLDATLLDKITDYRDFDSLRGTYYKDATGIPKNRIMISCGEKGIFVPEVTEDGFFKLKTDTESSRSRVAKRNCTFARYADLIWTETKTASLSELKDISSRVHAVFPKQKAVYNNSPSFNWDLNFRVEVLEAWIKVSDPRTAKYQKSSLLSLADDDPLVLEADKLIAGFHDAAAKLGVKFHFITLPTFHSDALVTHQLTRDFHSPELNMLAYTKKIQRKERELGLDEQRHQEAVGTPHYDAVNLAITGGKSSTTAMHGSTEEAQFVTLPTRRSRL